MLNLQTVPCQVFRTNSSYSRWLDARKTWGLVLNRSRDLVRQVGLRSGKHTPLVCMMQADVLLGKGRDPHKAQLWTPGQSCVAGNRL